MSLRLDIESSSADLKSRGARCPGPSRPANDIGIASRPQRSSGDDADLPLLRSGPVPMPLLPDPVGGEDAMARWPRGGRLLFLGLAGMATWGALLALILPRLLRG